MTINYPGPWEIRINYTTVHSGKVWPHQHRLSIAMSGEGDFGDPFSAWTYLARDASSDGMDQWLADYIGVADYQFHTDTDFTTAELWKYAVGTFNADFYAVEVIGANGTSAVATVPDAQTIYTIRTTAGGVVKSDWRDTVFTPATYESYPFAITDKNSYIEFLSNAQSPVIGRDNSYAFAPLKFLPGGNERYFKKRLR